MTFYEIFIRGEQNEIELNGLQNFINTTKILRDHFQAIGSNQVAASFTDLKVSGLVVKEILRSAEGSALLTTPKTKSEVFECKDLQAIIKNDQNYDLVMYEV